MSEKTSPQEIDLLELFQRIGKSISNLFGKIFKVLIFLIGFGIRKIHFLILFAIIGGLIGWGIYSTTKRYYSSDLVAQPNGISSVDMVSYINDLHHLTEKRNVASLALALNMKDSLAQKIKNIEAYHYIDVNKDGIGDFVDYKNTFNPKDTTQVLLEDRILIRVEVYDNNVFRDVKQGIFSYIKNNNYLLKLNQIRRKELRELIVNTEKEIEKLDSLQNFDYFSTGEGELSRSKESQLMILAEKDKQLYYRDKLYLTNKKQEYEKELELATDAITVIKDFTELAFEENPKSSYIIEYGAILMGLGYFGLLLIKFYRKGYLNYFLKADI